LKQALRLSRRALYTLALCAAIVVPVYFFVESRAPSPPHRYRPAPIDVDSLPPVAFPAFRDAVPVLAYRDISERTGARTVTPHEFDVQLAMLKRAGFQTISVDDFVAFLRGGGALPAKPLLLTFEGTLGSTWRAADPVLQKYDMRAAAFIVTGEVGKHGFYHLQQDELRKLIKSGRWDAEAQGDRVDEPVSVDATGSAGAALANLAWLPALGRREQEGEFGARVLRDYDRSAALLTDMGAPAARLYAYPVDPNWERSNDRRLRDALPQLIAQRVPFAFAAGGGKSYVTRSSLPRALPRIVVDGRQSAEQLLERLREAVPVRPLLVGFRNRNSWAYEGGRFDVLRRSVRNGDLDLHASARHWRAAYWSPAQSALWRDYRVRVEVSRLGSGSSGASASLILGSGLRDAPRLAVTLSAGRITVLRIREKRETLASRVLPVAHSRHRLAAVLSGHRLQVRVDGVVRADLAVGAVRGGIGLGVWRERSSSPYPCFSALRVSPHGRVLQLAAL
jgi:peptidoglycan/xylan/chitin deacetylase (PgdA/CDA1 family)